MLKTESIQVSGARIRYVQAGKGADTILLIHGFPETLQGWRKNVPAFSERHRVVAFDMVGFGGSDGWNENYTCRELARFVMLFMDALKIPKAHIVGGDSGALVAAALAAFWPERVEKLVLFSGTIEPRGIRALDVRLMEWWPIGEIGLFFFAGIGIKSGLRRGFFRPECLESDILKEYLDALSTWPSKRIALRFLRELGRGHEAVLERLRQGTVPTLVLWAEHEKYFYRWVPSKLRDDLKATLEIVADSGHFIQEEKPEIFNRMVLDFIERSRR